MLLLFIKLLLLVYLAILIPLYWKTYGPDNFLWLSDIGLFLTVSGVAFESPLLISMAAVGVIVLETIWMIDYFLYFIIKRSVLGVSEYMFNPQYSKFIRALSLFHVVFPIMWIILLSQWGYDSKAFYYQGALTWLVLILGYLFSTPSKNINWVFLPKAKNWKRMPPLVWLGILMIGIPLIFQLPPHLLFLQIF